MRLLGFDWNSWDLLGAVLFVIGIFMAATGWIVVILKGEK